MNDNPDVVSYLKRKYYKLPALPPTINNNTGEHSKEVQLVSKNGTDNSLQLTFKGIDDKPYALFYTATKRAKSEYPMKKLVQKINIKGNSGQIKLPNSITSNRYLAITFLDRYGKESTPIVIQPHKIDQK
jgi:5-keto 4-deoxyuronate isomerase